MNDNDKDFLKKVKWNATWSGFICGATVINAVWMIALWWSGKL